MRQSRRIKREFLTGDQVGRTDYADLLREQQIGAQSYPEWLLAAR